MIKSAYILPKFSRWSRTNILNIFYSVEKQILNLTSIVTFSAQTLEKLFEKKKTFFLSRLMKHGLLYKKILNTTFPQIYLDAFFY